MVPYIRTGSVYTLRDKDNFSWCHPDRMFTQISWMNCCLFSVFLYSCSNHFVSNYKAMSLKIISDTIQGSSDMHTLKVDWTADLFHVETVELESDKVTQRYYDAGHGRWRRRRTVPCDWQLGKPPPRISTTRLPASSFHPLPAAAGMTDNIPLQPVRRPKRQDSKHRNG